MSGFLVDFFEFLVKEATNIVGKGRMLLKGVVTFKIRLVSALASTVIGLCQLPGIALLIPGRSVNIEEP
jgi:hypothetical protein